MSIESDSGPVSVHHTSNSDEIKANNPLWRMARLLIAFGFAIPIGLIIHALVR